MIRPILNLLSLEEQSVIGREKLRRLSVAFFGVTALFIATGSVLFLPSFLFLSLEEPDILRQISISKESIEAERVRNAKAAIRITNERLATLFLEKILESAPLSTHLLAIADRIPTGIDMNTITFDASKETITLAGIADSRNNFLAFVALLKNHSAFLSIDSPVTNLLVEHNLPFTLTITLNELYDGEA